jgi:ketosteroid isomerase-like protein
VSGSRLRSWLEAFPIIKEFEFDFDRIDVDGNLAAGVGSGRWTVQVDGRDASATFKFADVFRRDRQGRWRYAHVIWNSDTPQA